MRKNAKFSVHLAAVLLRTMRKIEKSQKNYLNTEKPQIALVLNKTAAK